MAMIQRHLSPRALRAQRRNALESTGPRTPEGKRRSAANARRRGAAPDRLLSPSPAFNENGGELRRMVAQLSQAYQPANAAERLLVEDLAMLRLRQRRNQSAQDGLILKNLARLERRRDERRQEAVMESPEYPFRAAQLAGLINTEDSPAKYKGVGRLLRIMIDDVELGNFSEEGKQILQRIYGPLPTMRGARVLGNYIGLLEAEFRPVSETAKPAPAEEDDQTTVTRRVSSPLQLAYEDLLRALEEEKDLLGGKYQRFLAEHIPSDAALSEAALVPTDKDWQGLARQEALLETQIEKKTRLLLFTQWVRRSNEARAPYIENQTKPVKDE